MRGTFCKFTGKMASHAAVAKPTRFHELLAALNARGTLLRVYTQNIDGLELKCGLSTYSSSCTNDERATCIPLHGNLHQMRCQLCSCTFLLDPYLHTLEAGELPKCVICDVIATQRAQLNLRERKTTSFLRPDIILYGEHHPLGEEIAKIANKDAKAVDLLLVVGTSMKVDGIQKLFRMFVQSVAKKQSTNKAPALGSLLIDVNLSSLPKLSQSVDGQVEGDCELFAMMVEEELKVRGIMSTSKSIMRRGLPAVIPESTQQEKMASMAEKMAFTNRRLDLRPLWRYYWCEGVAMNLACWVYKRLISRFSLCNSHPNDHSICNIPPGHLQVRSQMNGRFTVSESFIIKHPFYVIEFHRK